MTTPQLRVASILADPGAAVHADTILRSGTVVGIGPPIQVDTGDLSLSCVSLVGVSVGQAVYLISIGNLNVILGVASTQIVQRFTQSVAFTASAGTATFPTAFPATCDGAVWVFDGSVGAGSISPIGNGARTATTIGIVCGGSFTGSLQIAMIAWGH